MKGLRKYLTPFAPDQSGAVSMCYALGGMVVIVDAGGCAGNICGFDEPRWQPDYLREMEGAGGSGPRVEAVFSAGLRDMDAILGRDDLLVKKLADASKKIDVKFIALVGTPVPAVIGTDLEADERMAEKATGLPCISISTDGMHLYDRGIEEALLSLVKRFSGEQPKTAPGSRICGVLGLNPLDLFDPEWTRAIRSSLTDIGYEEVLLYGMDGGLDALKRSHLAERNYVVSPAGIAAAKYMEERFRIPWEVSFPADPMIILDENACDEASEYGSDTDILVVHQQVLSGAVRGSLEKAGVKGRITCATWFDYKQELAREGDVRLREEDDFMDLVRRKKWDLIIADPVLKPMAGQYGGKWIDAYHFAVSGQAAIDRSRMSGTKKNSRETEKVEVWRI